MNVAIIGAGVIGLATAVALRECGVDVTCLDPRPPMSQRSAGATRIFRLAHGEPELIELARESQQLFRSWTERSGDHDPIDTTGVVITGDITSWMSAMDEGGNLRGARGR